MPAPLNLPFGKLFFGFEYVPIGGNKEEDSKPAAPFGGAAGVTLSGRSVDIPPVAPQPQTQPQSQQDKKEDSETKEDRGDPWAKLGSGNSLSNRRDVIDIDSD